MRPSLLFMLPGRTDNEIKNYWNTRIKRLQRAGLPLYPSNICFQALNESQSQPDSQFPPDKLLLQPSSCDTATTILDKFKLNRGTVSYTRPFPDIPVSNMFSQGMGSENYATVFPTLNHETPFPSFLGNATYGLPALEHLSSSKRIYRPFGFDLPYDPDPGSESLASLVSTVSGNRALPNGNFSTSQTLHVAAKLELPSLQYPETDLSSWLVSSPTTPPEAKDAHVESPSSVSVRSDCISPRNSGLLESLLHEAQEMASVENRLSKRNVTSSTMMLSDPGGSSLNSPYNMDWRDCDDAISPLGCSDASVFSAYTPTSISSLEESSPSKASDELNAKLERAEHVSPQDRETANSPWTDLSHRDMRLGSDWCHNVSEVHNTMGDAISALLDDLCDGSCMYL